MQRMEQASRLFFANGQPERADDTYRVRCALMGFCTYKTMAHACDLYDMLGKLNLQYWTRDTTYKGYAKNEFAICCSEMCRQLEQLATQHSDDAYQLITTPLPDMDTPEEVADMDELESARVTMLAGWEKRNLTHLGED